MKSVYVVLLILGLYAAAAAQEGIVEFTPDRWDVAQAKVVDHLGRKALTGSASLKAVQFENGVVEVDLTAGQTNIADIGYIPEQKTVICPAMLGGKVSAYRIGGR